MKTFSNEPFIDFTNKTNVNSFQATLNKIKNTELGKEYSLIINGKRVKSNDVLKSTNPFDQRELIGLVNQANESHAEEAMQSALKAFTQWKITSPISRARLLFRAAAILTRRKNEFSSWLVLEAGKNWAEADGDTAEAIDFLNFYAHEAIRLSEKQPIVPYPNENNELSYIPLGVGVVIPPWNFPLAIMAGMTAAAIVCGNTVVLKPASPTGVVAAKFLEVLEEAGMPDGVVNYVPGSGAEIGEYLVKHPKTRFISFTGSRDVGLKIHELSSKVFPGQIWMKRLVAEMGGKDGIIVDESADLELAADAITKSAFGFSGQKCSACSRAIVHKDVYDEVLSKVIEKTSKLQVGDPSVFGTDVGPVINNSAYQKVLEYIAIGKTEGELVFGGDSVNSEGFLISPTIFSNVDSKSRVSQEEIFGPVVSFTKADSFDEALNIVNNTEYGLTGGVFSRNMSHLERARQEYHVGNLYLNRKITGALVGVHPFGGFNMSGTDSKAGGQDYLQLFMQGKMISELF